uniref:Uncharacterized protein n=1 Tax=Brassica campestris TaxID=3711 RepID=A0A3P6BKQ2_BRACM|nr:unnamed protein product [Brassica rapa]
MNQNTGKCSTSFSYQQQASFKPKLERAGLLRSTRGEDPS